MASAISAISGAETRSNTSAKTRSPACAFEVGDPLTMNAPGWRRLVSDPCGDHSAAQEAPIEHAVVRIWEALCFPFEMDRNVLRRRNSSSKYEIAFFQDPDSF